ncbi:MAG TPA: glutathione S-transferase family protein [Polyangia bacterium]|jgi:glutathione S-transferase|nr:glutathione S-transferase family protein [Polyangia bacterium]
MGTIEGFQPSFEEGGPAGSSVASPVVKLYGTTTSPYTRKIRILTRAAGLPVTMVDTRTAEGAAALARIAPLGKVPVIEMGSSEPAGALDDGTPRVLAESGLIAAWLWARHEPALRAAGLELPPDDWTGRVLNVVVEGALDAAINRFYLLRDKLPDQGYVSRQADRVATALAWIDAHVPAFARPLSGATLSLGCALDWIVFRGMADVPRFGRLVAFREAWTASGVGAGTEPG